MKVASKNKPLSQIHVTLGLKYACIDSLGIFHMKPTLKPKTQIYEQNNSFQNFEKLLLV